MALTPVNSRMMSPAWGLKLTPSNSPYAKPSPARSPIKPSRPDINFALKQVLGNTTNTANAFDSLPSEPSFAFTAGAAAVIATVGDDGEVSQRFYRARPTAAPLNTTISAYGPSTPTANTSELRSKVASSLRDAGIGNSPYGSPGGDWIESPGNKSWSAKERIKAATCVSFSPDGKFLAVGETGYKPRVLIFSTASDAPRDTPSTSISDHTFGVCAVAFSPDSQYLASLGASNDGFLHIWRISPKNGLATLHLSNKCTTTVTRMAWMGNNLITVGTRHVKVWRLDDSPSAPQGTRSRQSDVGFLATSQNKTLQGRPCILGNLLESTFTGVVGVAPDKAIVCSEKGDICLLDDQNGSQTFSKIGNAGFKVTAMTLDTLGRLHLAGSHGNFKTMKVNELLDIQTPPQSPPYKLDSDSTSPADDTISLRAMTCLSSYLVTVDSQHAIRLFALQNAESEELGALVKQLPAHGDSILGVDTLTGTKEALGDFFTWSSGGTVLFWNQDGKALNDIDIELDQVEYSDDGRNELKVVRVSDEAAYLVAGDKYGFLSIIDGSSKSHSYKVKAHSGEITDVILHERSVAFIASAGRDRTVQVFHKVNESWDLLQTLDEHVGAVTSILFSPDGSKLISCSTDRTLVVRDAITVTTDGKTETAFVILRTITLKATPTSMAFDPAQSDVLIVSTIDRQVHRYDLQTGQQMSSFKSSDPEGGDAVVVSRLVAVPCSRSSSLVAAVASSDKSVRLYEDNGCLVKRDWGHTEGITGITLVSSTPLDDDDEGQAQRSLVTVAADGTIFIWSVGKTRQQDLAKSMELMGTPPDKTGSTPNLPLRRVLSQVELAKFQRSTTTEDYGTPSGNRSPPRAARLRKRTSKYSLVNSPRLDPPVALPSPRTPTSLSEAPARKFFRHRSPSPPSPRTKEVAAAARGGRRASVQLAESKIRTRSTPSIHEFGSIGNSADQVCRMLRNFRKKLQNSADGLPTDTVNELQKELAHTARAVGEKAIKTKAVDEVVMMKLLDQFSEKLVMMMDERLEEKIAERVQLATRRAQERKKSTTGESFMSEMSPDEDEVELVESPTLMIDAPPPSTEETRDESAVPKEVSSAS